MSYCILLLYIIRKRLTHWTGGSRLTVKSRYSGETYDTSPTLSAWESRSTVETGGTGSTLYAGSTRSARRSRETSLSCTTVNIKMLQTAKQHSNNDNQPASLICVTSCAIYTHYTFVYYVWQQMLDI